MLMLFNKIFFKKVNEHLPSGLNIYIRPYAIAINFFYHELFHNALSDKSKASILTLDFNKII